MSGFFWFFFPLFVSFFVTLSAVEGLFKNKKISTTIGLAGIRLLYLEYRS
jgi:hypothetical protein